MEGPVSRDDVKVDIHLLSPWVARVDVSRPEDDFGLHPVPQDQAPHGSRILQLGYREAPLHRVVRPDSPEATWEIHPLERGRPIGALDAFTPRIEQPYLDWFVESGDLRGLEIPWLLPSGSYFLVQSRRPFYEVRTVLLGNGVVNAPPGLRQLRGQRTFYSAIFGADRRYPPVIDQPLIGLAAPYYSGEYRLHGVLFFSFSLPRQLQRVFHTTPGLVLVIPVRGPLVLDSNKKGSSAGSTRRDAQEWETSLAPRFVAWCAGMSEV